MGFNKEEFILKEPTPIQYGTWTDPHLITPSTDPETSFTATDNVGYVRKGTITFGLNDEFVEYESETPSIIVRKDLLKRAVTLQMTINQFNMTMYEMAFTLDTQTGTYKLAHVGHDAPEKTRFGFLMSGQKVDGSVYKIAIWSGEFTTEDKSIVYPGNAHVDHAAMIQAFPGDTFTANRSTINDRRDYALIWEPPASS